MQHGSWGNKLEQPQIGTRAASRRLHNKHIEQIEGIKTASGCSWRWRSARRSAGSLQWVTAQGGVAGRGTAT